MKKIIKLLFILSLLFVITSCFTDPYESEHIAEYKVTYDYNYDDIKEVKEFKKGSIIELIEPEKRESYNFIGWFIDKDLTILYGDNVKLTTSITLYAKWEYVEPIILEPTTINIGDAKSFLAHQEVKDLRTNKVEYATTFDYFIFTDFYNKPTDGTYKNQYTITNGTNNIVINSFNVDIDALELVKGDKITIKCQGSYIGGSIIIQYAELLSYEKLEHYANLYIGDELYMSVNIKDYQKASGNVLPHKEIEGKKFIGYFHYSNFTQQYMGGRLTMDWDYYAKYEDIDYVEVTVHYLDNKTKVFKDEYSVSLLDIDIDLVGYFDINGFYFDSTYTNKIEDNYTFIDDIDIYYNVKEYHIYDLIIHYDSNTKTYEGYRDDIKLSDIIDITPSKDHYEFKGWYLDSNYNNIADLESYMITNTDLYAKFEYFDIFYTINVVINNGNSTSKVVPENSTISYLVPDTISNYRFKGWLLNNTGDYLPSNTLLVDGYNYYGVYEEIIKYTVIIHNDSNVSTYSFEKNTTLSSNGIKDLSKTNYTFNGYMIGSIDGERFELSTPITSNLELYASFTEFNKYTVKVYTGTTLRKTYTVYEGTSISTIDKVTKATDRYGEYTFSHWCSDQELNNKLDINTKVTSDMDIYSAFTVLRYYWFKIKFDFRADMTMQLKGKNTGKDLSKQSFKDDDNYSYTFNGYYYDEDYNLPVLSTDVFTETENTLYAKVTKTPYLTITSNYLDTSSTQRILQGKTVKNLVTPVVNGYTFKGWFTDSTCQVSVPTSTVITEECSFYAKLNKNITVIVSYLSREDKYSLIAEDTMSSIKTPTYTDYICDGIYFEDTYENLVPSNYVFSENITLYAKMVPLVYHNIYIYKDTTTTQGLNNYTLTKMLDSKQIKDITKPSIAGYTFLGWFAESTFTTQYNETDLLYDDMKVYAKFSANTNTRYMVKYYTEGLGGQYTFDSADIKYGTTDSTILVTPVDIEYYDTPVAREYKIRGDGNGAIEFYYQRSTYTVKYYVNDELYLESEPVKWGYEVVLESKVLFEEFFLENWYLENTFDTVANIGVMSKDGINLYGKVEMIETGTTGLLYELTTAEDSYKVVGYTGTESIVIIPNGYNCLRVTEIATNAFLNNTTITSITMSDYITYIGNNVFTNCINLENITLSKNITSIGKEVFKNDESLKELILPSSLKDFDVTSLVNLNSLEKISIPSNDLFVTVNNVLYSKDMTELWLIPSKLNVTNLTLLDSVKTIKSNSIINNSVLETINLNKVENVEPYAFNGCTSLKEINVSSNVINLGLLFVYNCPIIENINVDSNNIRYSSNNGILYNKSGSRLIYYPSGKKDLSYTVLDTVKEISSYCFNNTTYLKDLYLLSNIVKINYLGIIDNIDLTIHLDTNINTNYFHNIWQQNNKEVK